MLNISFDEMIEKCGNHSIAEHRDEEIRITGELSDNPKGSWFHGFPLAKLGQRDEEGLWCKSYVLCRFDGSCSDDIEELRKIETGSKISVIGILESACDSPGSCSLRNCRIG